MFSRPYKKNPSLARVHGLSPARPKRSHTMLRRSRNTSSTIQATSERRLGGGGGSATRKYGRSSRDGGSNIMKRCIFTLPILFVFFVIVKKPRVASFASLLRNMVPSALSMSGELVNEQQATIVVPSCPATPWKANEDIRGKCSDSPRITTSNVAKTVDECATSCCNDDKCITWQYRRDVGCVHFGDIRLGMEKDGPAGWCSEQPPQRWQGQYILKEGLRIDRNVACNEQTWDPNEEVGQCLGLGDVRPNASGSAVQCMKACCADEKCGAWQWNEAVSRLSMRLLNLINIDIVY